MLRCTNNDIFILLESKFKSICFKPLPIRNFLLGDYVIRLPRSVDCVIQLPRFETTSWFCENGGLSHENKNDVDVIRLRTY